MSELMCPTFKKNFFSTLKKLAERESIISNKGNIINDTCSWKKLAFDNFTDPYGICETYFDNPHL